ncbi:hypothetical protein [Peribacillus sp. TH14]|uniref:hypothetical protein n=1 Tax=Peribacillus sp. TH14 TaxID=2798481 RepID=UPI001911C7B4|nr:hypothetical protein [Peribacillus sp. TH14]MBK5502232.1 hypothetical protein [Peribacillus sp. TH14]
MDKYLDLTLYLEEELDYTELIDKLFIGIDEHKAYELNSSPSRTIEQDSEEEASSILSLNKNEKMEQEDQSISSSITRENFPSFTKSEKEVIKDTIKNYTSGVEPRKVIRLNNALILLKKLNNKIDTDSNDYKEELKDFIINFLEVNNYENNGTDSLSYTERIANPNNPKTDNLNKLKDESNESELDKTGYKSGKYLKFTEYFIHNKRQLKESTRKV